MNNPALVLLIDFNNLHEHVQNMKAQQFTPGWVLRRLDALIERLENLQLKSGKERNTRQWQ